ncbi:MULTISPECIES: VPDSG-CTERM sorting domain-containing protein [unclassified Pseudomonas]|nr:VPDSG-CTERM sorting domain-containing protein [Pseudomonas sp. B707]
MIADGGTTAALFGFAISALVMIANA